MANKKKQRKTDKSRKPPVQKGGPILPAWLRNQRIHLLAIVLLGLLINGNTLTHDYAQDDAIVITDNVFTQQGITGIPGILQYDTFYGFFQEEGKANLVSGGRYRPLSLVQFAIEYQFFGESPFWGHLFNVLYYCLTGIVLYYLVFLLFSFPSSTNRRPSEDQAVFIALVSSLLFIAHPIHTEVVANIKGRDEILALLGSLWALYLSLWALKKQAWYGHLLAGIVFFLALLSKENAITFLAIVPLSLYIFTPSPIRETIRTLAPYLAAAGIFLIIRGQIVALDLGAASTELMNNPFLRWENGQYVILNKLEQLPTILHTLGKYVQLLIFPHPLTHDYYPRHIDLMEWTNWQVVLSLLVYLGMGVFALFRLRPKDPIAFCILYYLITLSIVSNIIFPVGTNMSERFLFMPSVGFCMLVSILLWKIVAKNSEMKPSNLNLALGIGVLLLIGLSLKTILRNPAWKDNYSLFTTDIYTSPNSAKLRNAIGGELVVQSTKVSNESTRLAMLQEAKGHLLKAVEIHPTYKNPYLQLGNCSNYLKDYAGAIEFYNKALVLDPNYKEANNNLAITYRQAGRYYGEEQGNLDLAIQYLERARQLLPNDYEVIRLLGVAHGTKGIQLQDINLLNKAIEYFSTGTQLQPNDANAWLNLGNAYYNAGNSVEGEKYRQKAASIDPNILK